MKILVIFTGGTIGSVVGDKWISVSADTKYKLIEDYKKNNPADIDFDTDSPYYILSENLSAKELTLLYSCIKENLLKNYDGIIVTHGTDTLQYSASAMSFLYSQINIPIVFVSSAFPLEDMRENGSINFVAAVEFIKSKCGNGVFVSYKNDNENKVNIHMATRLKSHSEASSDIYSIDNNPYAHWLDYKIYCNSNYIKGVSNEALCIQEFCSEPRILVIESKPGDSYKYSLDKCNVVILAPYHSATLDVDNQNFVDFCVCAKEKNIPVFLVNITSGIRYESVKKLEKLNIVSLPFCSKIPIYMKCWIAISGGENVEEYVLKPMAQEFIERI